MSRGLKGTVIIVLAIVVWAIVVIPGLVPGTHTSTVERIAGSEEERDAIRAAEAMDVASVLGVDRYSQSGVNDFRWSNVVDGETIGFYQGIIDEMDRTWDQDDARFEYRAECQHADRLLLFPSPSYIGDEMVYATSYTMVSSNAMAEFEGSFRYLDIDHLPRVGEAYLMEDAHIIRQHLSFDYSPSGEYHLTIEQLVILDGDHDPVVLMSDPMWQEIPVCW